MCSIHPTTFSHDSIEQFLLSIDDIVCQRSTQIESTKIGSCSIRSGLHHQHHDIFVRFLLDYYNSYITVGHFVTSQPRGYAL